MQLYMAATTKDSTLKKMLLMMAMQQQMQAAQFQQAKKQTEGDSDKKDKDKEEKDSGMKIPEPDKTAKENPVKAATPDEKLMFNDKAEKKKDDAAPKNESVNNSTDDILNPKATASGGNEAPKEKTTAKAETQLKEDKKNLGDLKTALVPTEKNAGKDNLESRPKLNEAAFANIIPFTGNLNRGPASNSDVARPSLSSLEDHRRKGFGNTITAGSSSGEGGDSEEGSSKKPDGLFDMLMNQMSAENAQVIDPNSENVEGAAGNKKKANIFEYASFRYEYAAYKENRLKGSPKK
jgi:hypothetical protein